MSTSRDLGLTRYRLVEELCEKYKDDLGPLDMNSLPKIDGFLFLDKHEILVGYILWKQDLITRVEVIDDYRRLGVGTELVELSILCGTTKILVANPEEYVKIFFRSIGFKDSGETLMRLIPS